MSITVLSKYPGAIDSYTELPLLENNISEINEDLPNTQTDAILKIETTLGVNPQGSKANLAAFLDVSHNPDGTIKPFPSTLFSAEIVQDRNVMITGGGTISWSTTSNALAWTERLEVRFPVSGNAPTLLDPTTAVMPAPNYVLAVLIARGGAPQLQSPIVTTLADVILNHNDAFILAWRDTTGKIYWRNGSIYTDTDTHPFHKMDADRIQFNPLGNSWDNGILDVQTALVDINNRVLVNNDDTLTLVNVKEQESITRDDNIQAQVDDIFPHQDRNLYMIGGNQFSFNNSTGDLSFTGDIRVFQPTLAGDAMIRTATQSPIKLPNVGDYFYIELDRTATADYDVTVSVSSGTIPVQSTNIVLGVRISTDAVRLFTGDVITLNSLASPYTEGESTARDIRFDNSVSSIVNDPDTVQKAIDEVHARLDSLDTTVGGNNFVPNNGIIMMLGSTCPAGYLAVPELNGLFIRGGTNGSTTAIGTNTHVHTGSTNTAGNHAHTVSDIEITLPIQGFSLGGGGIPFDAFDPTFSSATPGGGTVNEIVSASSGSVSTTGNHSHTFTTSSQNHVPQHAELLFCRSAT